MLTTHEDNMLAALPIDQWISLYQSATKADRIKAGKSISRMTREEILDLKKALDHRHIQIKGRLSIALQIPEGQEEPSNNGNGNGVCTRKVFWGEDEWGFLVSRVSSLSLKEPTTGISNLATRIMEQMSEEQRRPTHAGLVSELSKRLVEYNKIHWLDVEHELKLAREELTRRREAPSRSEIIASLTEEETQQFTQKALDDLSPDDLCSRFSEQTLLDCISTEAVIAHAFIKTVSNMGQHTRLLEENLTMLSRLLAEMPQEKIRRQLQEKADIPVRLPQVAFVGFKADQIAIVADSLRGRIRIDVIDKNRSRFDSAADIIIMWKKFISHSFEAQIVQNMKKGARLIRFGGGLESAAREIERALTL